MSPDQSLENNRALSEQWQAASRRVRRVEMAGVDVRILEL